MLGSRKWCIQWSICGILYRHVDSLSFFLTENTYMSDKCSGQNLNQFVVALFVVAMFVVAMFVYYMKQSTHLKILN